nr:MAG TPA: hypothetical protein [Caudoviricetes sp.]
MNIYDYALLFSGAFFMQQNIDSRHLKGCLFSYLHFKSQW